jgi:hypothetical protein
MNLGALLDTSVTGAWKVEGCREPSPFFLFPSFAGAQQEGRFPEYRVWVYYAQL